MTKTSKNRKTRRHYENGSGSACINKRLCVDCINFKTITITKSNIYKFPLAQCVVVLKKLKRLKSKNAGINLYFCKRDMLKRKCYIENIYTKYIINKTCQFFDQPIKQFKVINFYSIGKAI